MKLTLLQIYETPFDLSDRYERYPPHFQDLFGKIRADFSYETIYVLDGDPLPNPAGLEGIIIMGSSFGVYDDPEWMEPLRDFIRKAYAANTPMLGICFGHQIMADALGGEVRKSDKGWGLGHHRYELTQKPDFMKDAPDVISLSASHQDQVITPPETATTFLASEFCPHGGLIYDNGKAMSLQAHPEFERDFSKDLLDIRLNNPLTAAQLILNKIKLDEPLDDELMAVAMVKFFNGEN